MKEKEKGKNYNPKYIRYYYREYELYSNKLKIINKKCDKN